MLSVSFPTSLSTAVNFAGKTISSQPCHVRENRTSDLKRSPLSGPKPIPRQILISATATATEATSTKLHHAMVSSSCTSLYEILGIATVASDQEIKAAYRRLARVSHPDVATVDRKDSSADEFMKIRDAYSTLSDPEKRASYDRSLFRRQQPLTAMRFSGHGCRNWETDQCW